MKALGIKIPLSKAEQIRKRIFEKNLVDKNFKIEKNSKFLYIPILRYIEIKNGEIVEHDFEKIKKMPRNYKEIVNIPTELKPLLPTSYDIIGKIVILRVREELLPYKNKIGRAFLKWKNVKSVAIDKGVKGDFRIRDLEIVAGSKNTETTHKENSLFFKLDISKVYFSPRLATERARIQKEVRENEIIIDMFAGVGPFSILIAKKCSPKIIYAIDINKEAIKYLKENIKINRVKNIMPICADAKHAIKKLERADRIIMNLPHTSFEHFFYAQKAIKSIGTIHYYEIIEKKKVMQRIEDLKKVAKKKNYKIEKINKRVVKTYSGSRIHLALDLQLKKII